MVPEWGRRLSRTLVGIVAPAVVVLTACQAAGDASIQPSAQSLPGPASSVVVPHPAILGVTQGVQPGQMVIRFGAGTSADSARTVGEQYGLELIGEPLVTGPLPSGSFVFQSAQPVIQAETPTTAIELFPSFTSHSDRIAFLRQNNLHFSRWLHSEDADIAIAEVKLPPSNLHPLLIDRMLGDFRIALPAGLTRQSVLQWAVANGLRLVDYIADSGLAIVRPLNWKPPLAPPLRVYPVRRPPPAPVGTRLYVQFATSMSTPAINTIVQGLSLGVVSISPSGLAILTVSPNRVKAEVQLLSDIASVQCVSTLPRPCTQIVRPGPGSAAAPSMQQFGQPASLTARILNGMLELDWTAASGATAYALFKATAAGGPLSLVAIVAGQQRTSFQAFELAAPDTTTYFNVVALHPCAQAGESSTCDALTTIASGGTGAGVAWSNTTGVVGVPAQTSGAAAPLAASSSASASAADGHVVLTWAPVVGAVAYRIYRATGTGAALYIAQTSALSFTDVGGKAGTSYSYQVAAVAADGVVGAISTSASTTWVAATTTPMVVRALPAAAAPIAGRVRFQVDARSGTGNGTVEWRIVGAPAVVAIGTADGQPSGGAPLSWSAALLWDTAFVPDGTYTVTATVIDAGGPQVTISTQYRIQNGAPEGPSALSAIAESGGVALTWQQAASETGVTYRLFRDKPVTGAALVEVSADRRSYVDSHVTPGQHVYQLVLLDAAGHASLAATATVTVKPAAPVTSPAGLDLNLTLPNGQEVAAGGRVTDRMLVSAPAGSGLKFQVSSNGSTWQNVGRLPVCRDSCVLDFDVSALAPGPYLIRATAAGELGNARSFVRADAARYEAPGTLSVVAGALGAQLSWATPHGVLPAYFTIERRTPSGAWQLLDRVSATSYIDSRAPAGVELRYRVAAVDLEGTGGQLSNEASVTLPDAEWAAQQAMTMPSAPEALQISASHGRATLRWAHVAGSNGYRVERQSDVGGPFADVGITGDETFSENRVLSGGAYTYRVSALNGPVAGPTSAEVSTVVMPSTAPPPIVQPVQADSMAPRAPVTVKATNDSGAVHLTWSAASGTSAATNFVVYRVNPQTGLFTEAASNLQTTTFTDAALRPGVSYGYVVTATTPAGLESTFSSPAWVTLPAAGESLMVELAQPVAALASFVQSRDLTALARVTGVGEMTAITFDLSSGGGGWRPLPTAPLDPRAPSPAMPGVVSGGTALWGASVSTTSLAPGAYQLRVRVWDRGGRTQEQVQSLYVAGSEARGPPSFGLIATPIPGGVRVDWTAPAGMYTVQRSLFGSHGPFESLGITQSSTFDDRTAIPGIAYSYRVTAQGSPVTVSAVDSTSALPPTSAPGGPRLSLSAVSASELAVNVGTATLTHPLDAGLRLVGQTYEIDATSMATGVSAHRLGEPAQLTFTLPAGTTPTEAAAIAIYHWDDLTAQWIKESSALDPDAMTVSATLDHLSVFALASSSTGQHAGGAAPPPTALNPPRTPEAVTASEGRSWSNLPANADGEIPSLRTPTSSVYRNPDGSYRRVINAGLVNYKDSGGSWQKIDTTLTPTADGGVRNTAGPLSFDMPGAAGSIVVTAAGGTLAMSIRGARGSRLSSSGSSASYASILPGLDASYQVVPSGLAESLLINERPHGQLSITYDLVATGLTLSLSPDGSVSAVDATGAPAFALPAPWMMETPGGAARPGAPTTRVAVSMTGGAGRYQLTYSPDMSWLTDPARLYPVTLDPSITFTTAVGGEHDSLGDMYGNIWCCGGWSPNWDYPVGYDGNGHIYRMVVGFDYGDNYAAITCTPCYATSAYLRVYEATDDGYGSGPTLYAYEGTAHYSAGADVRYVGTINSPATAHTVVGSGPITFNVTSIVQSWETVAPGGAGTFLMTGGEGACCNDVFLYATNAGAAYAPQLTIYYNASSITSRAPDPMVVQAGSIVNVPVTVTNTSGDYNWNASDLNDLIRLGTRGYITVNGGFNQLVNQPRTYLPQNVNAGQSVSTNFVLQAPSDPGDYWYQIDVTRDLVGYPASKQATIWFSDICYGGCNAPINVHIRVVAPGDAQASAVPTAIGDGSSLSVNTSNGSATLSASDFSINELGTSALAVTRTYNGINASVPGNGTNSSSPAYGVGWTYNFQRNLQLGPWVAADGKYESARNAAGGLYTDSSGKSWPLVWNPGRGLWEDALGGRTVAGPIPVDLIQRDGNALQQDTSAPFGHELYLDGSQPSALVVQALRAPSPTSGTIEVWIKPNFTMSSDGAEHVLVTDVLGRFTVTWNQAGHSHQWCFLTKDADLGPTDPLCSTAQVNWTTTPLWHQLAVTWSQSGNTLTKSLYVDGTAAAPSTTPVGMSPAGDMYFGYRPNGANGLLKAALAGLRIDGTAFSATQISADFGTPSSEVPTATDLYFGTYVNSASSAGTAATYVPGSTFGYAVLTNNDQTQEIYDPGTGRLVATRDRTGNQIDYGWDVNTPGRITSVTDHTLGRALSFCYSACAPGWNATFRVTDPGNRTADYTVNATGDLVSVIKANNVPDPRTGFYTPQSLATGYSYAGGHLMQEITDPRGIHTNVNYGSSYRQAVMADEPAGYWRLGETGGTTAVDSAGTFNGAYAGTVVYGQQGAVFGDGLSTQFQGGSVNVPYNPALNPGGQFTLETWVLLGGGPPGPNFYAIASNLFNGAGYELEVTPGTTITAIAGGVSVSGGYIPIGQWAHIVETFAGGTLKVYVNGVLTGSAAGTYTPNTSCNLLIGADYAYQPTCTGAVSNNLFGWIDEVAVYPVALSAARVQAHFLTGRLGMGAASSPTGYAAGVLADSPLGYWRLGEYNGNRAFDHSGYGHSGTYSGGYTFGTNAALTTDPTTATWFDGSAGTSTLNLPGINTVTAGHQTTVEFWMYWQGGSTPMPFGFNMYDLFLNWPNQGSFGFNTGNSDSYGITLVPNNTWIHVAAVFTNGSVTSNLLYIDGISQPLTQLQGTPAAGRNVSSTANISGWPTNTAYKFQGWLQDVAVYDGALPAARVQAHYAAGRPTPPSGSYASTVLQDFPSGYWKLNETSTSSGAADSSGYGHAGTYYGSGTKVGQPSGLINDLGYSTRFDGGSSYVGTPNQFIQTTISVEAWVYANTYSQSGFIISQTPVNQNWELFVASGLIYWRTGGTSCGAAGSYSDLTVTAPSAGVWHQIVAVQNGGVGQLFIDGLQVASASGMKSIGSNTTYPVEIGRFGAYGGCTGGYYFNGLIDDVSMYTSALTPSRVLSHYQASRYAQTSPPPTADSYAGNVSLDNPIASWRLDEPGGTTAYDRSGFADAGSVVGGVTLGSAAGGPSNDTDTAATFDGATGYINFPDNPTVFNTPVVSVEAWIKATTWVPAATIVNRRTTGNVGGWIIEPANNLGQINFYVYVGGAWRAATSSAQQAGVWHDVVGTYDGATVRIYVDGLLSNSASYSGTINYPASPLILIGKNSVTATYFNGSIDEVAVYGLPLSAARIAAHYAAASGQVRVANIQDGRGNTTGTFVYNVDAGTTQVIDALGQSMYYTFQRSGGRTISVQDAAGDLTTYAWNGRSAFQLDGSLSPAGILDTNVFNTMAPVGQQQMLLDDRSSLPPDQTINFVAASTSAGQLIPAGATQIGTWTWDYRQEALNGIPSHSSPFTANTYNQHYFLNIASPLFIPAGSTVTQWIYLPAGVAAPAEIMLQFYQQDGASWEHRAYWGANNIGFGTSGASRRLQPGAIPLTGHWVPLTVQLSPVLGTPSANQIDVGMENHQLGGIAFDVWQGGSGGSVWWGPTVLDLPPAQSVTDTGHETTTYAYNQYNDQVATVDPNGIARVTEYDVYGRVRQESKGLHAAPAPLLFEDPLTYTGFTSPWTFDPNYYSNTAAPTTAISTTSVKGYGSLSQTHSDSASASDLYRDVTGLRPGTPVRVSVWVQASAQPPYQWFGGVQLWVDDGLLAGANTADSPIQRRSALVNAGLNVPVQIQVPFVVDETGKLRIHLVQMDMNGSSYWGDVRVEDLTPVPQVTLQPGRLYLGDFEQSTERPTSVWALTAPTSGVAEFLNDSTQARSGAWVIHMSSPNNTSTNGAAVRTLSVTPGSSYHLAAWVRTVASGSVSAGSGAGAQMSLSSADGVVSLQSAQLRTNGQWQLLTLDTPAIWYSALTLKLTLGTFRGDIYFDDVTVDETSTQAGNTYWFSWADSTNFSIADLHVANPGTVAVTGALFVPGQATPMVVNVAAGADATFSLVSLYPSLNSGPLKLVSARPVITSLRTVDLGGSYAEIPGQSTAAAANNLYLGYYDSSTSGFSNDNVYVINPGPSEVSGTVTVATGTPARFHLAAGAEQVMSFAATAGGPVVVTATSPVLAAQRVFYNTSFSEVTAQAAVNAATTVYFANLPGWALQSFTVINPAWVTGTTWSLTATLAGGSTQTFSAIAAAQQTFNYNGLSGAPVKIAASVPVLASERATYGNGFYEINGLANLTSLPTVTYFNRYDATTGTWIAGDTFYLLNPSASATATGTISGPGASTPFTLAPGQSGSYSLGAVGTGPVTVTSSSPVLGTQRVSTVALKTLTRYHSSTDHWSTTGSVTAGYVAEGPMGQLQANPGPGLTALYDCLVSGWDHMMSGSSNCEGTTVVALEGYLTQAAAPGMQALYRCLISADHFTSNASNCEGFTYETRLGYLPSVASNYFGELNAQTLGTPGAGWQFTTPGSATATAVNSSAGGTDGGASRSITVSATTNPSDVSDVLQLSTLRSGASYLVSAWLSTSTSGSVDLSVRDVNGNRLPMDQQSTVCSVTQAASPVLCEFSFTYNGADLQPVQLTLLYGGAPWTVTVTHPLLAMTSQVRDYSAPGQVTAVHDIWGHNTSTTYDANGLYPTGSVITASPSPSLVSTVVYNAVGQLIFSTRVSGAQSIAEQVWRDSWGRVVGDVKNCVPAVAPPGVCTGSADAATNVMVRSVFDADGNVVDRYTQGQAASSWVNTHYLYDGDNNRVAEVGNCVTVTLTGVCDGASGPDQNVVVAFGFDVTNRKTDSYTALPGCVTGCVPLPVCVSGPPSSCAPAPTPCPSATCVDDHTIYDLAGRILQDIANNGGIQNDPSSTNLITQYSYDAEGRVTQVNLPIDGYNLSWGTNLQTTGALGESKRYDVLGRLVADIKAYLKPEWMSGQPVETDFTLDAGGRVISSLGPGTGQAIPSWNRVVTNTVYDDLGRPISVTVDPGGINAVTRTVYDPRGLEHTFSPATSLLPGGVQTTKVMDLANHTTAVINDDGAGGLQLTTRTSYDGYGHPTDVTDPRGIVTHTTYDTLDRTLSVTQNYCPAGNSNSNCSGTGVLPDQNLTTTYAYDRAGNATQIINPRGIVQYTVNDTFRRMTSVIQDCVTVPSPPATSCGTQTSDQNVVSSQSWDQAGEVLTNTDPLNRLHVSTYDAVGHKVSSTVNCTAYNSGVNGATCTGTPTTIGQNLTTQWQVDPRGDVLQEFSPRQCTTANPCFNGTSGSSLTDGYNLETLYTYDSSLRLLSVTEDQAPLVSPPPSGHLGLLTSYTYDPTGNRLTQVDGNNNTTAYTIDNLGRTTRVTDASTFYVQTSYSAAGEVLSTTNARGQVTTNTLDRLGRITSASYFKADGLTQLTQSFGYDADSNKTSFADTDVAQTTVVYDHLNRVFTVTAPSPRITQYTYFLDGSVNQITDPSGTTTFTEDKLGRSTSMSDPLNGAAAIPTTYAYDAAGRLVSRTESYPSIAKVSASAPTIARVAGTSVAATWNADEPRTAGHLLIASASSYGGTGLTVSAGWTQVALINQGTGNLRVGLWYRIATGADTAPTFTASGASRVEAVVSEWKGNDPTSPLQANTVATAQAASGNAITLTMAAAPAVAGGLSIATYSEHLGNSVTVSETPSAGWTREAVRTVSDNQHLGRDYRANPSTSVPDSDRPSYTTTGTVNAIAGIIAFFTPARVVTTPTYTGTDLLASKSEVSGSTTLASWTGITYDFGGNRTAENLSYYAGNPYPDTQAGTSTYAYDSVNQLSQSSISGRAAANYGYDPAHNLTSNAGTLQAYNPNESLLSIGATTIDSDKDGNLKADVGGHAMSWNSLSQLEAIATTPSASTYTYDALGRLATASSSSGVQTQFVYRGMSDQLVQELNSGGGEIRAYVWDTIGRQLYMRVNSSVYYEITDPHGDVVALASQTALVGTQHFDAWGNVLSQQFLTGTRPPSGFQGASGAWTDLGTGMVHMGARWYYPQVGRFLSSDPAAGTADPRTPMDRTRWLYALDNPLGHVDPTGLNVWDTCAHHVCDDPSKAANYGDDQWVCDAACQAAIDGAARARATPPPPKPSRVCGRGGCYNAPSSTGHSTGIDPCNAFGLHWCAAAGAATQVKTVKPDWSQLTADNIRDASVGWMDEGVSSTVDLACMTPAALACNLLDVQGHSQHLVSDGIKGMGGTVNTNSEAYQDGRQSFVIASIVASGPGVVRDAPMLFKGGLSLLRGARGAGDVADLSPTVATDTRAPVTGDAPSAPSVPATEGVGTGTPKTVGDTTVYQRDDLIDLKLKDARGRTNEQRMSQGLAPVGPDGQSVNLHHVGQCETCALQEMTKSYHQDNYSSLHSNTGQSPSEIDRDNFNQWRRQYWIQRLIDMVGVS